MPNALPIGGETGIPVSDQTKKYMNTAELAEHLCTTTWGIHGLVARGVIPRAAYIQRERRGRRLYVVSDVESALGARDAIARILAGGAK